MEFKPIALVIEDDEDQNAIFSAALERAGYSVERALNGRMAKEILSEVLPSLITLDFHLPDFNGDVILRHIRNTPRLKDVVVILATSDSSVSTNPDLQKEFVLLKPVGFSQLSQLASRFTEKPISS